MTRLEGKVALVTGAANGIGREIAIKLSKEGGQVVISDIDEQSLKNTFKELSNRQKGDYFAADVSNKKNVSALVKYIIDNYKKIDILVNNAGGSLHTPKYLEDIEEDDWDKVLNVNLKGTFLTSQAVAKYMKKNQSGKIINLSSIGGRTASLVTGAPYAAAKGGVISLTRRIALELGEYGINVNTVAPGLIISGDRLHNVFYKESSEKEQEKTLSDIPLKKLGEIKDIVNCVVFLASDESRYVTGAVMDVNGGRFMG